MDQQKMDLYTINQDMTMRDALLNIEKNRHRCLVVLDDDGVVAGTISDGDIRKALINNIVSTVRISKIMNYNFQFVREENREQAEQICVKNNFFVVPVVDEQYHLKDIFVYR